MSGECMILPVEQMNEHYFPKWIPVTERMPEERVFVLVFTCDKVVGEAIMENNRRFYWANTDEDAEPLVVTHWMPLPEPPEED